VVVEWRRCEEIRQLDLKPTLSRLLIPLIDTLLPPDRIKVVGVAAVPAATWKVFGWNCRL